MNLDVMSSFETAAGPVRVPAVLHDPQRITRDIGRELRGGTPDKYGAVRTNAPDVLLVRVHPDSIDRSLRIADALILACEARSFELRPGKPGARNGGHLRVVVGGEAFDVSIEERMRRVTRRPGPSELAGRRRGERLDGPAFDYVATGELTLRIGYNNASGLQCSWTDTRLRKIEGRLGEVMLALRQHAAWRKSDRERMRQREERFQAEQERRSALRSRVEAEGQAVARLEKDAEGWRRAETIRAYVRAVQAKAEDSGAFAEKTGWIVWALAQADRIDPLSDNPPSVLDIPEAELQPLAIWQLPKDQEAAGALEASPRQEGP